MLDINQLNKSYTALLRRQIKTESDLDIVDENYKSLSQIVIGFEDRIKYNHNDLLDLMQHMQELEKKVEKLQPKKSLWTIFKRKK